MPLWRTPLGGYQRAWARTMLLFARPGRVPRGWLVEQCRLSRSPGYLEAHLTALRALVRPWGQREVLTDRLPLLEMPTLVVWGARDRVFPKSQGRKAAARLRRGPSRSSRTPATYPTSRARSRSWQPWKGFSPDAPRRSRHGEARSRARKCLGAWRRFRRDDRQCKSVASTRRGTDAIEAAS
jgi:hypothetical protein